MMSMKQNLWSEVMMSISDDMNGADVMAQSELSASVAAGTDSTKSGMRELSP